MYGLKYYYNIINYQILARCVICAVGVVRMSCSLNDMQKYRSTIDTYLQACWSIVQTKNDKHGKKELLIRTLCLCVPANHQHGQKCFVVIVITICDNKQYIIPHSPSDVHRIPHQTSSLIKKLL